mmetsp:Transcript_2949/g.8993  ORF Transcript_2949/g.8993 Transcript_2949/m.8993 type:complete len:150 (+) Transcript_2949:349-798(+)
MLPPASPTVNSLRVYDLRRLHQFRGSDRAILTVDMDVDFTPLWNWNVKQIFVFVVAEYRGSVHRRNGVVIFDHIIESEKDSIIKGRDLIKYPLVDEVESLKDVSIQLKLGYDVHPLFGPMQLFGTGQRVIPYPADDMGTVNFTFPTVYN